MPLINGNLPFFLECSQIKLYNEFEKGEWGRAGALSLWLFYNFLLKFVV